MHSKELTKQQLSAPISSAFMTLTNNNNIKKIIGASTRTCYFTIPIIHGLLGIQIHLLCKKNMKHFFPGPTNIELIVINKQPHEYDRQRKKKTSFPFFDVHKISTTTLLKVFITFA